MKILNLYAGIGGNRKLWGDEHDVQAVEIDMKTAQIYHDYFPEDDVYVGDAHKYLLENYDKYDFIWTSPPCPSHSKMRYFHEEKMYPDMKLYQEIIFLREWFDGKWLVENVEPYYEPLIRPTKVLHRHLFWSNFKLGAVDVEPLETCKKEKEREFLEQRFGYDLSDYSGINKRKLLRNCIVPELGKHILDRAQDIIIKSDTEQTALEL